MNSVPTSVSGLILGMAIIAMPPLRVAAFEHFEARQVHPVALSPDARHLLALNSPASRLSVFRIPATPSSLPIRIAELPVGLEPTSVRARTDDEFWVVNEASDSVSILSLSRRAVIATLECPDEPADIAFAGDLAFVTCARNSQVRVFNARVRTHLTDIPLRGLEPRALTTDAAGTRVFVAFQHSGNQTTVLAADHAPVPPAPTNPALATAPQTALIVPSSDRRIPYAVLDHDVAEISVSTLQVTRYLSGAGTLLFDLALRPNSEDLWIANTEARNLVRFEPVLRGHIADNRLTRFNLTSQDRALHDLNPGIDYATLPNAAARDLALAQPTALAFTPDGLHVWVAASGSDRVACIDANTGSIRDRVDLRRDSPSLVRGPRGLALDAARNRLYVLNKLANTLSVIDSDSGALLSEVPVGSHDPTPPEIRRGRGFLFDARLSGNGIASCATCHPDTDRDGLAWDLGDPAGPMIQVTGANLAAHDIRVRNRPMHPMKGPMVTQTLRGMSPTNLFHWRGDRPTLHDFNATFPALLGGPPIPAADIDSLQSYLNTVRHHPNPNRLLDGALPLTFRGGNPRQGKALFDIHINHCGVCHAGPIGSNNNIDDLRNFGGIQSIKTPPLQTTYQRALLDTRAGATNVSGFGLGHDGTVGNQFLPTVHFYELDELVGQDFTDVTSYVLCFDSGTHPAVGWNRTVTTTNCVDPTFLAALSTLQAQASFTNRCSLVAHGFLRGRVRHFQFDPRIQAYIPDRAADPALSGAELLGSMADDDSLNFLVGLPSQGALLGIDRNQDGAADGNEPIPALRHERLPSGLRLSWPDAAGAWVLEQASSAFGPWDLSEAQTRSDTLSTADIPTTGSDAAWFRLRRTW